MQSRKSEHTLELDGCDNLHGHDRLQNDRASFVVSFSESCQGSDAECQFRRIDSMISTILKDELDTRDGMAGKRALLNSIVETLDKRPKDKDRVVSSDEETK